MAPPPTAAKFNRTLDPHEILDWKIPCDPLLETDEVIADFDLTPFAELIALGLTIMTGGGRDPAQADAGTAIKLWLTIADAFQEDEAFDAGGVALPIQLHIVTNSSPLRERDRATLIQVAQL